MARCRERCRLVWSRAIQPYWEQQFAAANPVVVPTDFVDVGDDIIAVIDQQVFDLSGAEIAPRSVVYHRYTFDGNLVRRMRVFSDLGSATAEPGAP